MEETKKAIVLAAGSGTRWKNYLGIPKQLIKIDGEPLLFRTIRQLRARGFEVLVTVPSIGYFGEIPAKQIVGVDEIEVDKFINAKEHVGAIFFWGDTYFTDEAMDKITKSKYDLRFFGRKRGSEITGKNYGEIFAVKTNEMLFRKAEELRSMVCQLKRCASWELYRLICGYPLDQHIIDKHFTDINDLTDDFDYPKDYDKWTEAYRTSKPVHVSSVFQVLHKYSPKRILHIGGHTGEEGEVYKSMDAEFTFVEPVPEYAEVARKKGYDVMEVAIGERGEKEFNVRGVFSSFLLRKKELLPYQERWLAKHKEKSGQIKVKVIPLSDIQEGYDTLVVDTEGTVLDVLKSGQLNFKTIIAEVRRDVPAYDNELPNEEIVKYLKENGYVEGGVYGNNTIFTKDC